MKLLLLFLLSALILAGWWFLGAPENHDDPVLYSLNRTAEEFNLTMSLNHQKLIRNPAAFEMLAKIFIKDKKIQAGGYKLNRNMNAFQIISKLSGSPDYLWVTVPEGMRREQIGELIGKALLWDRQKIENWNRLFTDSNPEYAEGVYYPDTYLLPKDESPEQIANRFIDRFNGKMEKLFREYQAKNIRWTTGLVIASLIQREAAGPEDMPLISGIIWNRMDQGIKLDIDATLQYLQGKIENRWWAPVYLKTKKYDSPYNTYIYKGLPPGPICSPGIDAIKAALYPVQTDCLFYLHADMKIHCARTYKEHLNNIEIYLKN